MVGMTFRWVSSQPRVFYYKDLWNVYIWTEKRIFSVTSKPRWKTNKHYLKLARNELETCLCPMKGHYRKRRSCQESC